MTNPNTQPLAQDFALAAQVPDAARYFFHDPNLTRLDDGALLIAAPQWGRKRVPADRCLRLLRSDDGGLTWDELPALPFGEGTPFVLDGQLLMFVQERSHRDFQIVASDDGGRSWSDPVTVLEAPVWNISTSMVARPDVLYWAMDHDLPDQAHNGKVMVRLTRGRSALDRRAWSMSDVVQAARTPERADAESVSVDGAAPTGRVESICVAGAQHGRGARADSGLYLVRHRPVRHGPRGRCPRLRPGGASNELYPAHFLAGRAMQVLRHPRPGSEYVLDAREPGDQFTGPARLEGTDAGDRLSRGAGQ